jgi:hypothetical protein
VTVSKEQLKSKLDLVGVKEVRCNRLGTEPEGEYTFFCGKWNENHELNTVYVILCMREYYQQLRRLSLLVI